LGRGACKSKSLAAALSSVCSGKRFKKITKRLDRYKAIRNEDDGLFKVFAVNMFVSFVV
jgi:hypothetical protein